MTALGNENFISKVTGEKFHIPRFRTYIRNGEIRYTDESGNPLTDERGNPLTRIEPREIHITGIQTETANR